MSSRSSHSRLRTTLVLRVCQKNPEQRLWIRSQLPTQGLQTQVRQALEENYGRIP